MCEVSQAAHAGEVGFRHSGLCVTVFIQTVGCEHRNCLLGEKKTRQTCTTTTEYNFVCDPVLPAHSPSHSRWTSARSAQCYQQMAAIDACVSIAIRKGKD